MHCEIENAPTENTRFAKTKHYKTQKAQLSLSFFGFGWLTGFEPATLRTTI